MPVVASKGVGRWLAPGTRQKLHYRGATVLCPWYTTPARAEALQALWEPVAREARDAGQDYRQDARWLSQQPDLEQAILTLRRRVRARKLENTPLGAYLDLCPTSRKKR